MSTSNTAPISGAPAVDDSPLKSAVDLDPALGPRAALLPRALGLIANVMIVLLMLFTTVDVIWRATLGAPISGVQDWSTVFLAILAFAGIAETQRRGGHVNFEALDRLLSPRVALALTTIGYLLVIVFLGVFFVEVLEIAIDSIIDQEFRLGVAKVPIWPARLALPVGVAALAYVLALQIIYMVRQFIALSRKASAEEAAQ